jgi:hypothetical protein
MLVAPPNERFERTASVIPDEEATDDRDDPRYHHRAP